MEFALNVDVIVQENGTLDVYIAEESGSGTHYSTVNPDTIGQLVSEQIQTIITNF